MIDEEDLPAPQSPLGALLREDLSTLGEAELNERIAKLKMEIARAETAIKDRQKSLTTAEAFFKKQ